MLFLVQNDSFLHRLENLFPFLKFMNPLGKFLLQERLVR